MKNRTMYKRSDYIQSITATELNVQDWQGLMNANNTRIRRLQTFKRVVVSFWVIVALGALIMALITL